MVAQARIWAGERAVESAHQRPGDQTWDSCRLCGGRIIAGAFALVSNRPAQRWACHSNALDRPNSRPKLRCTVAPVVVRFSRVADREGLIGVRQRRRRALTWGWREQKTIWLNRTACRRLRV